MLFSCLALCTAMVLGTGGAPVAARMVPAPETSLPQAAAVLTIISGGVVMRDTKSPFSPAADGAVVYVGNTLRTGIDARAVITLFEGSTVELEPGSDITIEEATTRGGSTIVQLAQSLGRSWHVVTHLTTADSRYEVKTPAATASVRGTSFEVAVVDGASGRTTVTTTEGLVATTSATAAGEVLVAPDQTTTVRANGAPEPPRSAPDAHRVVTVTAVAESSLVVDPLGRANGFKDGRVLAQTPGARVRMENGTIIVTLPNVPEGVFATTATSTSGVPVSITTTVADAGEEPITITTDADATGGSAGVELRKQGGRPELRSLSPDETKKLSDAKAAQRKTVPGTSKTTPRAIAPVQLDARVGTAPAKNNAETPRATPAPRRTPIALPTPTRR